MPFDGTGRSQILHRVFIETQALFADGRHWHRFDETAFAADGQTAFCLIGALRHVCDRDTNLFDEATAVLVNYLPSDHPAYEKSFLPPNDVHRVRLSSFNDRREFKAVQGLLQRALEDQAPI
jgi:hypothetical protein